MSNAEMGLRCVKAKLPRDWKRELTEQRRLIERGQSQCEDDPREFGIMREKVFTGE